MVATTLAQQFGGTLQGKTLEDINQQAQQMYTGNRAQQRLAMRGVSATSNDPNRWGGVSGNRWAGGTDISPELANIPNDDGSFNGLKGQSTAGGQNLTQYYGKDNIYTDQGRNDYIQHNILDKGYGEVSKNTLDNVAQPFLNEDDVGKLSTLASFYNKIYGKGDFNTVSNWDNILDRGYSRTSQADFDNIYAQGYFNDADRALLSGSAAHGGNLYVKGDFSSLPTYGMPAGWTEKDMGNGQYQQIGPNGEYMGTRYGTQDQAIQGYTRQFADQYAGGANPYAEALWGAGYQNPWENPVQDMSDPFGLRSQKQGVGISQQDVRNYIYNQMMSSYGADNSSLRKAEILSGLQTGKGWYNTETAKAINDKYLTNLFNSSGSQTEGEGGFGSELNYLLAAQQPKVDMTHTQNHDAFGNNSTDLYNSLFGSKNVYRGGKLVGYEGQFLDSPEQSQWNDKYSYTSGANALTKKKTTGIDQGNSTLAAQYGDNFANYNQGNGKFYMTPEQAQADANIPIYDQYRRSNEWDTGPSLGMNIGKFGSMATLAAMGGAAFAPMGTAAAGFGAAIPSAMATGLNGNWNGALTGLGLGAISGGIAGQVSPALQQGLGSMFGDSISASTAQALARGGAGAMTSAGTKGLSNLLQNNRFGQGMGEAAVQGSLAGLGSLLAGSNASVAQQQQMGRLASNAGKLASTLYKTSKTKKG